jgi:hypothetical protein
MQIIRIESSNGDVFIKVPSGSLVDGNPDDFDGNPDLLGLWDDYADDMDEY